MRKIAIASLFMTLMGGAALKAAEMPEMPKPVSQHKWLHRFVGNWDSTTEMQIEPGKPPMKIKTTETFGMIGGFWVVGRGTCSAPGMESHTVLTIGYDTAKKKYVGTWVDSSCSYLWKYEGDVDASGNKLTLYTEGPNLMLQGKVCKFREVTEFKGPDHRIFTSSILQDGKWVQMLKIDSHRRKAKK